jgi:hypothetical protein
MAIKAYLNKGDAGETSGQILKLLFVKSILELFNNLGRLIGTSKADFVRTGRFIFTSSTPSSVSMTTSKGTPRVGST